MEEEKEYWRRSRWVMSMSRRNRMRRRIEKRKEYWMRRRSIGGGEGVLEEEQVGYEHEQEE